jgi:DHA3 family macrolide efflux protein-like MFS transporter
MIKALKNSAIKQLWIGQALSSIGDEVYRVGLTWLAVGILGNKTGWLSAGQMATLMIVSFFGGKWADKWDPLTTMIRVDLLRAFLVLIPVIISYFLKVPLWILILVAFSISGLSAFFDPSVQATLPIISNDPETLQSTNGLMSTTTRMARMIGPTLIGLLVGLIPTIHFFTIDSLTFILSAFSLIILCKKINYNPNDNIPIHHNSFKKSLNAGFELAKRQKDIKYILLAKALTAGTWNLVFNIGFALLIYERTDNDVRSYGLLVASYGLGNFLGALFFGNIKRINSRFYIFFGYAILGLGFFTIGISTNIKFILAAACYTGFTGPLNDLSFIEYIQHTYSPKELTKIFRLRQSVETLAGLILMLLSPFIIKLLTVSKMISAVGILWILVGLIGIFFSSKKLTKNNI